MAIKTTSLIFNNHTIKLTPKRVKYLRLKVGINSEISLSVPLWACRNDIINFLHSNKTWLEKTLEKMAQKSNDTFKIFGKVFELNFDESIYDTIFDNINQKLTVKNRAALDKFLLNLIRDKLNFYINLYSTKVGKNINRVSIKKMKTRWGSCNHKKGYINLNANLVHKDDRFIEYVVLHELTHLIYAHHQKSFYDFIHSIMPDFKMREQLGKI